MAIFITLAIVLLPMLCGWWKFRDLYGYARIDYTASFSLVIWIMLGIIALIYRVVDSIIK